MELIHDLKQNSGSMPLRWCLSEAEQSKIIERELSPLFVVIDLYYGAQDTKTYWWRHRAHERLVVPIEQFMQYVPFSKPGPVHVCVAVVAMHDPSPEPDLRKKQLTGMLEALRKTDSNGTMDNTLFQFEGDDSFEGQYPIPGEDSWLSDKCEVVTHAHLRLTVDEGHFGKPFTGWLKWWVEWVPRTLLRRRLVDQCDQRRWAIFAFTAQPIIFPITVAAIAFLYTLVFVIKLSDVLYRVIWQGYRTTQALAFLKHDAIPGELEKDLERNGWSSAYTETRDGTPHALWRRFLQPASLTLVGSYYWFVSSVDFVVDRPLLAGFLLMVFAVSLLQPGRSVYAWLRYAVGSKLPQAETAIERARREDAKKEEVERAVRAQEVERMRQLISDLSCPLVPAAAATNKEQLLRPTAIPAQHRTMRLYYEDMKGKFCKPLAR